MISLLPITHLPNLEMSAPLWCGLELLDLPVRDGWVHWKYIKLRTRALNYIFHPGESTDRQDLKFEDSDLTPKALIWQETPNLHTCSNFFLEKGCFLLLAWDIHLNDRRSFAFKTRRVPKGWEFDFQYSTLMNRTHNPLMWLLKCWNILSIFFYLNQRGK